jgi:hypothetical protein
MVGYGVVGSGGIWIWLDMVGYGGIWLDMVGYGWIWWDMDTVEYGGIAIRQTFKFTNVQTFKVSTFERL